MQDQTLSPDQVLQLTAAMLSVAAVDGIQDAELALIRDFYEAARSDGMPPATALGTPAFSGPALAPSTPEFAETAVLMCLMTAYADGRLSAGEWSRVQAIAQSLGADSGKLDTLTAQVRDELSAALAGLPDAGSVAKVVAELERIG